MSMQPNMANNLVQSQNIVLNQVPLTHAIMTNVNPSNGIPIATALISQPQSHQQAQGSVEHHQPVETKQNVVIDSGQMPHQQLPQASNVINVQQVPAQPIPVPTVNQVKSMVNSINSSAEANQSQQVLSKLRLQDLIRETDPTLNLEDEVEEIILNYVDEFVDRVLNGAALIAKNRHVNAIEVKDVQQFLSRNYDMWTPGFGTDELRPYKRSFTTESHKQRLALIRKTLKKY